MKTIDDLGPSKLLASEQQRIRYAADNLIFSRDLATDVEAREALGEVETLCRDLVGSGRWQEVTATRLMHDMCECGPAVPANRRAA
jgi:hypothetical protein